MTRSFRGTAFLLRDLLEEDDEYTGHHTEDVVALSVGVAEQMGVSEEIRRETELGALLHDIGKIHIPDAIINKPGPLDDAEWALMKTHTIEGQRMLDQVGGLLTSVGLVVRASHERFDGGGYPDGLAGEAIPLAARIVAACDSFNAMTTTRSYRKALPVSHAVEELRRCAGTPVRSCRGRRAAGRRRRSGLDADGARSRGEAGAARGSDARGVARASITRGLVRPPGRRAARPRSRPARAPRRPRRRPRCRRRELRRQVRIGDRALDRVAVAAGGHPPRDRAADANRLVAQRDRARVRRARGSTAAARARDRAPRAR